MFIPSKHNWNAIIAPRDQETLNEVLARTEDDRTDYARQTFAYDVNRLSTIIEHHLMLDREERWLTLSRAPDDKDKDKDAFTGCVIGRYEYPVQKLDGQKGLSVCSVIVAVPTTRAHWDSGAVCHNKRVNKAFKTWEKENDMESFKPVMDGDKPRRSTFGQTERPEHYPAIVHIGDDKRGPGITQLRLLGLLGNVVRAQEDIVKHGCGVHHSGLPCMALLRELHSRYVEENNELTPPQLRVVNPIAIKVSEQLSQLAKVETEALSSGRECVGLSVHRAFSARYVKYLGKSVHDVCTVVVPAASEGDVTAQVEAELAKWEGKDKGWVRIGKKVDDFGRQHAWIRLRVLKIGDKPVKEIPANHPKMEALAKMEDAAKSLHSNAGDATTAAAFGRYYQDDNVLGLRVCTAVVTLTASWGELLCYSDHSNAKFAAWEKEHPGWKPFGRRAFFARGTLAGSYTIDEERIGGIVSKKRKAPKEEEDDNESLMKKLLTSSEPMQSAKQPSSESTLEHVAMEACVLSHRLRMGMHVDTPSFGTLQERESASKMANKVYAYEMEQRAIWVREQLAKQGSSSSSSA
jgi:hypothetical protein